MNCQDLPSVLTSLGRAGILSAQILAVPKRQGTGFHERESRQFTAEACKSRGRLGRQRQPRVSIHRCRMRGT